LNPSINNILLVKKTRVFASIWKKSQCRVFRTHMLVIV
jgi:hypothetical protein